MYFEEPNNVLIMENFLQKSEGINTRGNVLPLCREIIADIVQRPNAWDENCSYNIDDIGVDFMSYLGGFDSRDDEYINGIYSGLIRFLCEYDLNNSNDRLSSLFSSIKKRVLDSLSILENGREKEEILFALYEMPIKMLKTLMNNKDIKSFVSIENTIKELEIQKMN